MVTLDPALTAGALTLDPRLTPGWLMEMEGLESVVAGGLNLSTPWAVSLLNSAGVSTKGFPCAVKIKTKIWE